MSSAKWCPFCLGFKVLSCVIWLTAWWDGHCEKCHIHMINHDMEMLSALLALRAWNPPVTSGSPHKGPIKWIFDIFFVVGLSKLLNKQSRCQWFKMSWHSCDITVMIMLVKAKSMITCKFPPIFLHKTIHSTPIRMRYGVSDTSDIWSQNDIEPCYDICPWLSNW